VRIGSFLWVKPRLKVVSATKTMAGYGAQISAYDQQKIAVDTRRDVYSIGQRSCLPKLPTDRSTLAHKLYMFIARRSPIALKSREPH
jgi:hypothetical protein